MRAFFTCALAACLLLSATLASGQVPGPPPPSQSPTTITQGAQRPGPPPTRDNASPAIPVGTGRIRGRVLASETGGPLRLAQVRINGAEGRIHRVVNTDVEGRYEFTELPAARYSVSASKGGYVALQFGQRRAFEQGKPLELAESQIAGNIDFSLPRGSVIAGRIVDEYGEPVPSVQVQVSRQQYLPGGQRRLVPMEISPTDDLGQYRVFGLAPGEYLVSATLRQDPNAASGPPVDASDRSGYVTTYYPGTVSSAEAQTIVLGLGEEATAYFSLIPGRPSRVSGRVIDSQGQPVGGVSLALNSDVMLRIAGQTQSDGTFTLLNLSPGEQTIEVRSPSRSANPEDTELASVPIAVSGQDITDLVITTSRPATISGRLIFDGKPPPRRGSAPLRVMATSAGAPQAAPMTLMARDGTNGVVGDDGRFQLRVAPVSVLFRPWDIPQGWILKSVTLDGADITDIGFDMKSSAAGSALEIVLTDRPTTLSGTVSDSRSQPLKDYVVVILPRALKDGMVPSRFVQTARPDQEGRYQVRSLPPGAYHAVAVESLEQGRQWDPSFQEQMRPRAKSFNLKEGETLTLDLPLETAP